MPDIKLKLVARPAMVARVRPGLAGSVSAGAGVQVTSSGGIYTVGIDWPSLSEKVSVSAAERTATFFASYDLNLDTYNKMSLETVATAVSAGLDATLVAIAALTPTTDQGIYFTGSDAASTFTLTSAGRALVDDADATAQRVTLGLVIGTNVQAWDVSLDALATLTYAQGDMLYATGSATFANLAKSTTATRYMSNTGTSNAPAWAQVNLTNGVTGNLPVTNLNSGTGATATTFWRGDGTWGTPAGGSGGTPSAPQGRITLTTGTAVPTSDVTGATTHYYTPAVGTYVPITTDSGVTFVMTVFAELSQATTDNTKSPAAVANNSVYDIFLWSDGGTIRATRGPAWSSDTSRGTGAGTSEIDFGTAYPTNNVAITNGPAANMGVLVGTVRSNGSAQLVDSQAFRWVSNTYNAVPRHLVVRESTDTWTYSTGTWRQSNGSTSNQFDIIQSLGGGYAEAYCQSFVSSTSADHFMGTSIFLDTVHATIIDSKCITSPIVTDAASRPEFGSSKWSGQLPAGRSLLIWAERGHGAGTQTWQGDNGGTLGQAGMLGSVFC